MPKNKIVFEGAKLLGTLEKKPLSPEALRILKREADRYSNILEAGERARTTPEYNSSGQCPKCGSKFYFQLYGGSKNKQCAECEIAYDGYSDEEWLKKICHRK